VNGVAVLLICFLAVLSRWRFLMQAIRHVTGAETSPAVRRSDAVQALVLILLLLVLGSVMVGSGAVLLPLALFFLVTLYFLLLSFR
jgi:cytochrome b subunit of formate dehydrogenase